MKRVFISLFASLLGLSVPAAETPRADNVLFIIFDDMNDWAGYVGREGRDNTLKALVPDADKRARLMDWLMPNMDRLAGEGVAFTQAQANFPLCGPSRTCFLTGLLPTTTAYYSNEGNFREQVKDADKIVSLPEYLKQQGFLSVEAGKVFHKQRGGQSGPSHPQSDPQSWSVQNIEWCGLWWNFPPCREDGRDYPGNPWRYAPGTTVAEYAAKGETGAVMPYGQRWHNGIFTVDYFADNFNFGAMPGPEDERYAKRNRLREDQTFDFKQAAFTSAFLRGNLRPGEKFKYDAAPGKTDVREGIPVLKTSQRFFMAAGMFLPHDPYITPKSYHDELGKVLGLDDIDTGVVDQLNAAAYKDGRWTLGKGARSIAHLSNLQKGFLEASKTNTGDPYTYWKQCVFSYLACLKFADDRLGQLLQGLEESPHKGNTAIVLCGDNGLHLGSHEHWSKITLWQEATHVPLIIKAPGVQPGVCREAVGLVDLYPTILDLPGMEPPKGAQQLDGKSLMPQLLNPETPREDPVLVAYATDGLPFCYAVIDNRWRLHDYRNVDGKTFLLYDLDRDPYESADLVPDLEKNAEARAAYDRLKGWLDKHLVGKVSQERR